MSFLDALKPGYTPAPVDVEGVLGKWTGAKTGGGLSLAGGEIILTADHLVFTPWDLDRTRQFLVKALSAAGAPRVGDVDKLITQSKLLEPVALPLSEVAGAEVAGQASWMRPLLARLSLVGGGTLEFGVLAGPRRMNRDRGNDEALGDFLAKLRGQMTQ